MRVAFVVNYILQYLCFSQKLLPGMLFFCLLDMWLTCLEGRWGRSPGSVCLCRCKTFRTHRPAEYFGGAFQSSLPCSIKRGRLYVAFRGTAQKRYFLRLLETEFETHQGEKSLNDRGKMDAHENGYNCIINSQNAGCMHYIIHHIFSTNESKQLFSSFLLHKIPGLV